MKNLLLLLIISMPLVAFRGRVVVEDREVRREVIARQNDGREGVPAIAHQDASGAYDSLGFVRSNFTNDNPIFGGELGSGSFIPWG